MQIVDRLLRVTGSVGEWTDELGKGQQNPEVAVGVRACLRFDLRSPVGDPDTHVLLPLPVEYVRCDAYCLALDGDYKQSTPPKLLVSVDIVLDATDDHTYLDVRLPNTAIPPLLEALNEEGTVTLKGELAGYTGTIAEDVPADFAIQFGLTIRNRVYLPGGAVPPEVVNNPDYLTKVQVIALIEAATRPEKGDPGLSAYEIAVKGGYKGTEKEWLASLKGTGEPGKSAYEVAVAGGYKGTAEQWLASLHGPNGLNAYEVAVAEGYEGTVEEWLDSLQGADGKDLHFDATGELEELEAFAEEAKGFTFGASVTDAKTKTTKLYIYVKRSGEYNDWCNPTVITYYERTAEIKALEPVKLTAPVAGAEYYSFDISKYPHATVAAVCIDTDEGELTLPYGSALGVRKIVKTTSKMLVYFGTQCPEYETGKIYLTQFLGIGETGGSPVYTGTMYYGYIPLEVLGNVYRVGQIMPQMLTDSRSKIKAADTGTLDKTSLGTVPAGALVVVLLPSDAGLKAEKFDGVGGYTTFITDNVETGTGANGAGYLLNGTPCEIYGEYVLAAAEISVRITSKE